MPGFIINTCELYGLLQRVFITFSLPVCNNLGAMQVAVQGAMLAVQGAMLAVQGAMLAVQWFQCKVQCLQYKVRCLQCKVQWLQCKESMLTSESLLTILRTSDSVEELEAMREKVDLDIARQRSKDSGGDDGISAAQPTLN